MAFVKAVPMKKASLAILVALGTAGCGVVELPPPATPTLETPAVEDPRATSVPNGRGRLVLDAVDERVQVARVTSTTTVEPPAYPSNKGWGPPATVQTELLCITPCTVDLPIGAHELLFKSSADDRNQSRALVTVSGGRPLVVRHALGYDRPYSGAYVAGAIGLVAGIGFTLIGGLVLSFAALSSPTSGNGTARNAFLAVGGVVGGLGLTLDVVGIVGLLAGRAQHRSGATVAFPFEGPR